MQGRGEVISTPQGDYDALRYVTSETPCPYLPGRLSRNEVYVAEQLSGSSYERLLARGFRRSGRVVYRPRCRSCSECRSIRVAVDEFAATRSMRRIWRQNADVRVLVGRPEPTRAKFDLFRRYLDAQHDQVMGRTYDSFREFLYDSTMDTCEFQYFLGERLIGVSLADRWDRGLSSVYMFFDPDPTVARRSLGTFSVLWEIDYCRRHGLRYYYLGYYVAGSAKMAYKSRFRPNEILVSEERWLAFLE